MANPRRKEYPAAAYSPSGELWWRLNFWPGKGRQRFGVEPKLASWLNFNIKIGDLLTIKRLRETLGDSAGANTQEHFNRRFRNLRKYGWIVLSSRDDADLRQDEYCLEQLGAPIWLGKSKYASKSISDKTRREA